MDRRSSLLLSFAAVGMLMLPSIPAFADGTESTTTSRPRAPLAALLPATEKRILLERAVLISKRLVGAPDDDTAVQELKSILEEPNEDDRIFRKSDNSMKKKERQDRQLSQSSSTLTGKKMRAALNVYTTKLQFGESYTVTATPETKKAYIRANDGLPDIKAVITSDLDLRDLYRNELQLNIDDAQAELYSSLRDNQELLDLLQKALATSQQWFDMIEAGDVQEAREALRRSDTGSW